MNYKFTRASLDIFAKQKNATCNVVLDDGYSSCLYVFIGVFHFTWVLFTRSKDPHTEICKELSGPQDL